MDLYRLLRPVLFRLPPERAHELTLRVVSIAWRIPPFRGLLFGSWSEGPVRDPVELWDLTFPNRVGLAAGYDKDARAWRALGTLGFGHLELGTVTPEPQAGNPRPRVFRLPEDRALINRLGFPSRGMERFARNLPKRRSPGGPVLGINLGKQKETPLERAEEDYVRLLELLGPRADYMAINVSSPNTPELRRLQGREYLDRLARALLRTRDGLSGRRVPLLVKLAPDLSGEELDAAVDILLGAGVDGLIATNTTITRPGLRSPRAREAGGLSGRPLFELGTRVLERIADRVGGRLPLIAVGGVMSGEDARRKRDAGADLVQLYTGLVYRGPRLVGEAATALAG